MKILTNIIVSHAVFLAIFGVAALALAEETAQIEATGEISNDTTEIEVTTTASGPNSAAPKKAQKGETEAINTQQQMQVKAAQPGQKAQLREQVQVRVINLAANMSNRIDAAVERLQNISDRLDSRIQKLADSGIDTAAAEAALASAQLSITAAAEVMASIDTEVTGAVGSEDVRTAWTEVRETYTTVREHLQTAHSELRACVAALKTALATSEETTGVNQAVQADAATENSN